MKALVGKVMWMGRATVFLVGFAVILAAVMGVASMALAANGKPFILGKGNVATKISKLVRQGTGPALELRVNAGQPPMAVNSDGKVANLNADKVDGKDSGDFLASDGTASDSELLDGKDSADFLAGDGTAAAGGDLSGNYPNPDIATDAVGSNEISTNAVGSDEVLDGSMRLGDTTFVSRVIQFNPPNLNPGCSKLTVTFTEVEPNDIAWVVPSDALNQSLTIQPLTQDNSTAVRFRMCNESSSAVDDVEQPFRITLFRP